MDGNKRTALNTTELFYFFNGYEFEYGEDIRSMLKLFSAREDLINRGVGVQYLADQTGTVTGLEPLELLAIVLEIGVDRLPEEWIEKIEKRWEFPAENSYPEGLSLVSDENDHND